jgi:hypothetical protein
MKRSSSITDFFIKKGEETKSLNPCTAITGKAIAIFEKGSACIALHAQYFKQQLVHMRHAPHCTLERDVLQPPPA